jgi:two-component system, sensor histidine kinase
LQDGGGSGLGLHLTKGLVEQHAGTIEMFSDGLNLGCTTVIELPLYQHPAKTKSSSIPSIKSLETQLTRSEKAAETGHTCLVVDDSLPNRKLLVRLLERSGHSCVSANNGKEAVAVIEADQNAALNDESHVPIDTVLMDYEMPILNGPNATKIIREKGYTALIIGVTGNVLVEDVEYFTAMGANRVLPKPVNLGAIEQCWEKFGSDVLPVDELYSV